MTASDDPELENADDVLEIEYEDQEAVEPRRANKGPGRIRRFFRSVFTHLVFAGLVLGATSFFGYLNNQKIMRDVGDRVCAETMLGRYLSKGSKTTVAASPAATSATAPAAPAAPATPAVATQSAATTSQQASNKASQKMTMPAGRLPSAALVGTNMHAASNDRHTAKPAKNSGTIASASTRPVAPARQEKTAAAPARQPQGKAVAGKPAMTTPLAAGPHAAMPPKTAARPATASRPAPASRQVTAIRPGAASQRRANAPAARRTGQVAPPPTRNANRSQLSANRPPPNPTTRPPSAMPARPVTGSSATADSPNTKVASLAGALQQARQAQASGKAGADKIYKQLIRQFPNSPDLPGELGNIYYWQGKLAEAAEQYYETAQRLIRRNQPAQAACLLPVLKRIDPARAAALSRQTSHACPSPQRQ